MCSEGSGGPQSAEGSGEHEGRHIKGMERWDVEAGREFFIGSEGVDEEREASGDPHVGEDCNVNEPLAEAFRILQDAQRRADEW